MGWSDYRVTPTGTVCLAASADLPPAKWATPDHALQYLEARRADLAKAQAELNGRRNLAARVGVVLRMGALLDAAGVAYATRQIGEDAWQRWRLVALGERGRMLLGGGPAALPPRWAGPADARGYLEAQRRTLGEARDRVDFARAELATPGSQHRQQAMYAHLIVCLGAALDSVACTYATSYIEEAEYRRRRAELVSLYARQSVMELAELRG